MHTLMVDKSINRELVDETKKKLEDHLNLAEKARAHYNHLRSPLSHYTVVSFDFAENILLPNRIEEPGIFYFKTRRKIDCFGINDEKTNRQANFLIDECCKISNPDSVISMLDFYLKHQISKDIHLVLFADNCAAQNKNQSYIGYLAYLVKVLKMFPTIELFFFISGHTKFSLINILVELNSQSLIQIPTVF